MSEIFGPTIQGEGASLGKPAVFARVAGCPLACAWCDTPYSWDWDRYDRATEATHMLPQQVWDQVLDLAGTTAVQRLVLTGGEPAVHRHGLSEVARLAKEADWNVEVETSGSMPVDPLADMCDVVTVSPKLRSSGIPRERRIVLPLLQALAGRDSTYWKFVIDGEDDLVELDELVAMLGLVQVTVMPQADTDTALAAALRELVPAAVQRGYDVTTRLQVQLWGSRRGF